MRWYLLCKAGNYSCEKNQEPPRLYRNWRVLVPAKVSRRIQLFQRTVCIHIHIYNGGSRRRRARPLCTIKERPLNVPGIHPKRCLGDIYGRFVLSGHSSDVRSFRNIDPTSHWVLHWQHMAFMHADLEFTSYFFPPFFAFICFKEYRIYIHVYMYILYHQILF